MLRLRTELTREVLIDSTTARPCAASRERVALKWRAPPCSRGRKEVVSSGRRADAKCAKVAGGHGAKPAVWATWSESSTAFVSFPIVDAR